MKRSRPERRHLPALARGRSWLGIRAELFLIILVVLLLNLLLLNLAGSTLFEKFYSFDKSQELRADAKRILAAYQQGEAALSDALAEVENKNSLVTMAQRQEDGELKLIYQTRMRPDPEGVPPTPQEETQGDAPPGPPDFDWERHKDGGFGQWMVDQLLQDGDLETIEGVGDLVVIDRQRPFFENTILLVTMADADTYLMIDSPREYIRSTSQLAVKYTTWISVAVLVVGAVFVYWLVGRITRPVGEMQSVAERIARLDFSQSCSANSQDEIGRLATAINTMSQELQNTIDNLEKTNRMLRDDLLVQERNDRMRREFIANISHDFKTPLTLMVSYAETLREAGGDPEACQVIIEEATNLSHLVNQLLRLSQLESGMVKLEKTVFSIQELLLQNLGSHRVLMQEKALRLTPPAEDCIVEGDYNRIGQVFGNLLDNAIKYTAPGGEVRVTVQREGTVCRVAVFNTGKAIPQEVRNKLFISFYRADPSRHRDSQSYGLGLSIVKNIMELHGQPFGVENRPGGVEFWFTLPISELDGVEEDPEQEE